MLEALEHLRGSRRPGHLEGDWACVRFRYQPEAKEAATVLLLLHDTRQVRQHPRRVLEVDRSPSGVSSTRPARPNRPGINFWRRAKSSSGESLQDSPEASGVGLGERLQES